MLKLTAVLDANVLGSRLKRNILLDLARSNFFSPIWCKEILEETEKTIANILGSSTRAQQIVHEFSKRFPDFIVTDYDQVELKIRLPDENDEHVAKAAVRSSASVIVTENLDDFPSELLEVEGLQALNSDEFIAAIMNFDVIPAIQCIRGTNQRLFKNPPLSGVEFINLLESKRFEMKQVSNILRNHVNLL